MKTKIVEWTIGYLFKDKWDKINPQPDYQRGKVWTSLKKKALIDSILRDIDIPKIYLRKKKGSVEEYEVADGQQRLDAIHKFINNDLKLSDSKLNGLDLSRINGHNVANLSFDGLEIKFSDLKEKLNNYKLTIAIVHEASGNEIRTLFARLQMGNQLNPAEKRNAIISRVSPHIDAFALNHIFFKNCKISSKRFKHQDYITHAIALIAFNNKEPLKAMLLERLYTEDSFRIDKNNLLHQISTILDYMNIIDKESKVRIINKFSFIDVFWFLYLNYKSLKGIDTKGFAKEYDLLETNRKKARKDDIENLLIDTKNIYNVELYSYTMAYEYAGSSIEHIEKRKNAFYNIFKKHI